MELFWSFWIPANILFWLCMGSERFKQRSPYAMPACLILSFISGAIPLIIYTALT